MKKLGSISQGQLTQLRSLLGATEDGGLFPMVNNFRPIQSMDNRYPVYECGDEQVDGNDKTDGENSNAAGSVGTGLQGDRTYSNNINSRNSYNADTAEDATEDVMTGFNHVIAILAAVVGILCFVLTVGSFYFRGVLIRYERKLSDHIEVEFMEQNMQRVFSQPESDDEDDVDDATYSGTSRSVGSRSAGSRSSTSRGGVSTSGGSRSAVRGSINVVRGSRSSSGGSISLVTLVRGSRSPVGSDANLSASTINLSTIPETRKS